MRNYRVKIQTGSGHRHESIIVPAWKRSVAVKRALDHWQAGIGKRQSAQIAITCDCINGRIVPGTSNDTYLSKRGRRIQSA